ncbi:fasciclin domain-containing protein [Mongoliitalea daihaiensis]|uniref:fasciclin domain-containing protein n=1 Tax=Mongoliitalea daihaiensis TaxID=2782006 RepID=UPI001F158547|nr:fasciclin domain-containing protein [Mongoliitalea daihaiensis]UJP65989.1 fasciclin domain-containing protein [Mongoliitalea daihaiensis]
MKNFSVIVRFLCFISVLAIFLCCNSEDMPTSQEGSLWEIIEAEPDFSLLRTAVRRAGLDSALRAVGPITLFAPTNAGVERTLQELGVSNINQVPVDFLQAVLLYHILPGRNLSSLLSTGTKETLLPGFILNIQVGGNVIRLNEEYQVTTANVDARNGVLHIIDGMMIPPTNTLLDVAQENGYTTFVAAVVAAGLEEQLVQEGPFTLMVPSNAAFAAYFTANNLSVNEFLNSPNLQEILGYHMIPGLLQSSAFQRDERNTLLDIPMYFSQAPNGNFFLNGLSRITQTNQAADNGLIHEIDQVIIQPTQNIAEYLLAQTLSANPEFSMLVKALNRAALLEVFVGRFEDNFTLLAPTDQAFQALLESLDVSSVDDIPVETLTSVLLYHVIDERFFVPDLREGASIPTLLEGASVQVNLADNKINNALLIPAKRNILTENGVIHGIDQVLIPE